MRPSWSRARSRSPGRGRGICRPSVSGAPAFFASVLTAGAAHEAGHAGRPSAPVCPAVPPDLRLPKPQRRRAAISLPWHAESVLGQQGCHRFRDRGSSPQGIRMISLTSCMWASGRSSAVFPRRVGTSGLVGRPPGASGATKARPGGRLLHILVTAVQSLYLSVLLSEHLGLREGAGNMLLEQAGPSGPG